MVKDKKLARGRKPDGSPNDIDIYVGNKLKLRRGISSTSQEDLTTKLGISFQQIQKYERGANRISASRLYNIAKNLGVEIQNFFPPINSDYQDPMQDEKVLELIYYFKKIPNKTVAQTFIELLKVMHTEQISMNRKEY
ncbi:MAG: helix-turn-helix transcriptional regulator [Alphaproteobacteria bacterium]